MLAQLFKKSAGEVHRMKVMDSSGDRSVEWNTKDAASVAAARDAFDAIQRAGGLVVKDQPNGDGGGKVDKFDPKSDLLGIPAIHGG